MANDVERMLKLETCNSVRFYGKDKDNDTLFIEIEGETAQELLNLIHAAIVNVPKLLDSTGD